MKVSRAATDERVDRLAEDVMSLCDAYDELNSMERIIAVGEQSLNNSFKMIESLRKSL